MAQVASPYGLRPVQLLGGLPFAGSIRSYPCLANQTTPFYFGDPVALVAGQVTALTASPTNTVSANSPIGVFMGCEWQDPVRGFVNAQMFPANQMSAGATKVFFKILDFPDTIWKVQANGSVPLTSLGLNIALAALGTGNTATGDSTVSAATPAATTVSLAMRIIGFVNAPGSAAGDPFTDLLVLWNQNVHRYENGTAI